MLRLMVKMAKLLVRVMAYRRLLAVSGAVFAVLVLYTTFWGNWAGPAIQPEHIMKGADLERYFRNIQKEEQKYARKTTRETTTPPPVTTTPKPVMLAVTTATPAPEEVIEESESVVKNEDLLEPEDMDNDMPSVPKDTHDSPNSAGKIPKEPNKYKGIEMPSAQRPTKALESPEQGYLKEKLPGVRQGQSQKTGNIHNGMSPLFKNVESHHPQDSLIPGDRSAGVRQDQPVKTEDVDIHIPSKLKDDKFPASHDNQIPGNTPAALRQGVQPETKGLDPGMPSELKGSRLHGSPVREIPGGRTGSQPDEPLKTEDTDSNVPSKLTVVKSQDTLDKIGPSDKLLSLGNDKPLKTEDIDFGIPSKLRDPKLHESLVSKITGDGSTGQKQDLNGNRKEANNSMATIYKNIIFQESSKNTLARKSGGIQQDGTLKTEDTDLSVPARLVAINPRNSPLNASGLVSKQQVETGKVGVPNVQDIKRNVSNNISISTLLSGNKNGGQRNVTQYVAIRKEGTRNGSSNIAHQVIAKSKDGTALLAHPQAGTSKINNVLNNSEQKMKGNGADDQVSQIKDQPKAVKPPVIAPVDDGFVDLDGDLEEDNQVKLPDIRNFGKNKQFFNKDEYQKTRTTPSYIIPNLAKPLDIAKPQISRNIAEQLDLWKNITGKGTGKQENRPQMANIQFRPKVPTCVEYMRDLQDKYSKWLLLAMYDPGNCSELSNSRKAFFKEVDFYQDSMVSAYGHHELWDTCEALMNVNAPLRLCKGIPPFFRFGRLMAVRYSSDAEAKARALEEVGSTCFNKKLSLYFEPPNQDHQGGPRKVINNILSGLRKIGKRYIVNSHDIGDMDIKVMLDPYFHYLLYHLNEKESQNFFIGPTLNREQFRMDMITAAAVDNVRIIGASQQALDSDMYYPGFPMDKRRALKVPTPIDTDTFAPGDSYKQRPTRMALFYIKSNCDMRLLDQIRFEVVQKKVAMMDLQYGKYEEDAFRNILKSAKFAVLCDDFETQGVATGEILAMDVPIFVVKAISVPYFSKELGMIYNPKEPLIESFDEFYNRVLLGEYNPRQWVLDNMGLVTGTINFMKVICDLKNPWNKNQGAKWGDSLNG